MENPQPNPFGLRREAERHAALEARPAAEKRCRRFALPPQSKTLAASGSSHGFASAQLSVLCVSAFDPETGFQLHGFGAGIVKQSQASSFNKPVLSPNRSVEMPIRSSIET